MSLTPKHGAVVSDRGKLIHTTDKFDPWKYRGALRDAVLCMKPAERQSFQMTEVGK